MTMLLDEPDLRWDHWPHGHIRGLHHRLRYRLPYIVYAVELVHLLPLLESG